MQMVKRSRGLQRRRRGAGLAATFEPLRPYFIGGTVLALGFGFVVLRRTFPWWSKFLLR